MKMFCVNMLFDDVALVLHMSTLPASTLILEAFLPAFTHTITTIHLGKTKVGICRILPAKLTSDDRLTTNRKA